MKRSEILTAFAGADVSPEEMVRLEQAVEAARAVMRAAEVARHLALARITRRDGARRWLDGEGSEAVKAGGVLVLRRNGRGIGVVSGEGQKRRTLTCIEKADPIQRGCYSSRKRPVSRTGDTWDGWVETEVEDG